MRRQPTGPNEPPLAKDGRDAGEAAQSERLLLDQYLPEFEVTRVHHRVIDASLERTWEAVKSVDLTRVGEVWPITRAFPRS